MAKKFNFRLEPILKLRQFRVKEAEEALLQVVSLRIAKENQIEDKNQYLNNLLKSKISSSSASELQAKWNHKNFIEDEINFLQNEKKQLLEIEFVKRNMLTEVKKEEKILDKLKEKKKEFHSNELKQEETKILDEIGQNKHLRDLRSM